ncbi:L-seryl-tRNA(Sec) selenium transferase [Nocardioides mesophilus]|uniref:L-seryl-tRNA(Sec) selenium transferase n=1 Tax=Nocardioides mesophilus TaxID=433659 RepID=A0A7G9R9X0_9ACTN|nr:L-seryl-tRNA(Sec) selenium transferase [Nocardioides mesophilus]QNN52395.1 L-seryl-tRNA(Sec) selenium transferase [Nocardioides mesophilus]
MDDPRRATPRTDHVLADPRLRAAADRLGVRLVKEAVVATLERCRAGEVAPAAVADVALQSLPATAAGMRRVLNATGVVVHTNLGRAPLSPAAVEALTVAAGATDVELDLATGQRGRRGRSAMAALAAAVPDAGGVHVVNNGAAALALATCALAAGRNLVIARGEMVEIGDGFRIPELLQSVGATLREVGTTNRVRLADYAAAVDEETAFVLKVHPSNFQVTGFTSGVAVAELATLPVPVVVDIGSGLLAPHPRLPDEPSAAAALRAGADLVTASGDKLLGGPQCGLLLGTAGLVESLRRHPLARAMRVDKLTLAALEATLTGPTPPVAAALVASAEGLLARATRLAALLADVLPAEAVPSVAAVGGGGAPGVELPSAAVAVPAALAAPLRTGAVPVVGRVESGRLLLDLIAVPAQDEEALVAAVRAAALSLQPDFPTSAPAGAGRD